MQALRIVMMIGSLLALASAARPWGGLDEVGTSAAAWLIQSPSARILAMGGAGTAGTDGTEAWWYNPAAPAASSGFSAITSMRRHIADAQMGFASVSVPTPWGAPSLGVTALRTGDIPRYDALGQDAGTMELQDGSARFGWAVAFGPLSAGAAVTCLQEDFGDVRRTGAGGDFGLLLAVHPDIDLGLSALHFGRTVDGYPLPAEIRLGGCFRPLPGLGLAADLASPRDREPYLAAGAEWYPVEAAALRLGFRTGPAANWQLGPWAFFSAGAGLNWNGLSLDYAFEPAGALGSAHHLALSYHFFQPPPETEDIPAAAEAVSEAVPARPLQVEPRAYEGRMVFTPKAAAADLKAKSMQFEIKNASGKIVRTFTFAGQAAPKEWVWDGKDNRGRLVDQDEKYTFTFKYVTDQGVKTESVSWPQALPVRKLLFARGGEGVCPEAVFRFTGDRERVRSWRLSLLDRQSRRPVRVLTGQGALPEQVVWDGKDEKDGWAPPERHYAYQLEMIGTDYTQAVIEHKIIGVRSVVLSRERGRVNFKLLGILFDFARASIRAEMADKIEMAGELSGRGVALEAIQGHADEIGTPAANRIISRRRAEAVKKYLSNRGVSLSEQTAVEGFGKKRPAMEGRGEEARRRNRRVEIVLSAPEARAK